MPTGRVPYDPALDGLRAVAVVAVVLYHSGTPGFGGGARGVDVFFVLSGYLITSILADGRLSVADFWQRRLVRLMPALIAMVAFSLSVSPWLIPSSAATRLPAAMSALTYTMNLSEAAGPWNNQFTHTWSLAAEMQFYFVWPFLLPLLMRRGSGWPMIAFWGVLSAASFAVGALMLEWPPLVGLGVISYGVYLWHFTLHCMVITQPWIIKLPFELIGGVLLGWLSFRVIEQPIAVSFSGVTRRRGPVLRPTG